MPKNIALFGATGSIGSSVLKILDNDRDELCLKVITCNQNISSLVEISKRYGCSNLGISDTNSSIDTDE